jgi:hypothetical protein
MIKILNLTGEKVEIKDENVRIIALNPDEKSKLEEYLSFRTAPKGIDIINNAGKIAKLVYNSKIGKENKNILLGGKSAFMFGILKKIFKVLKFKIFYIFEKNEIVEIK